MSPAGLAFTPHFSCKTENVVEILGEHTAWVCSCTTHTHTPGVSICRQKLVSHPILAVHLEQVGSQSDVSAFRSSQFSSAVLSWCAVAQRPPGRLWGRRDVSDVPRTPHSRSHTTLQKVQLPGVPGSGTFWVQLSLWWRFPHAPTTQVPITIRHAECVLQLVGHAGLFHPSHTPGPGDMHTHISGSLFHAAASGEASAALLCSCSPSASSPFLIWLLELAPTLAVCCLFWFGWIFFFLLCCLYLFNGTSCSRVSALLFSIYVFDFGQHIYRHQLSMQLHRLQLEILVIMYFIYIYIFHYLDGFSYAALSS